MHERDWTPQGRPLRAQGCDSLAGGARESTLHAAPQASRNTPLKHCADRNARGETCPG
jgi:hypothetical protein